MTDWSGMSEDEIQAFLADALATLRARAEKEALEQAEQGVSEAADYSWPPAPNTEHPWMALHARFVREWMKDDSRYQVLLPAPRKPLYRFISEPEMDVIDEVHDHLVLDIRRVMNLAPWTGDPFVYMWKVAVDKYQRWVAGDSWREPVPPWVHVRFAKREAR